MSKKITSPKKISKKEARQIVYDKLVVALAEFKSGIKDKKFEANLRKSSKLFADDAIKAANKAKGKALKPEKKTVKKKVKVKPKQEEQKDNNKTIPEPSGSGTEIA